MCIEIRRSSRRTLALEVTLDARVIVRAPFGLPDKEIERFIHEKAAWIDKNLKKVRQRKEECQSQNFQVSELLRCCSHSSQTLAVWLRKNIIQPQYF